MHVHIGKKSSQAPATTIQTNAVSFVLTVSFFFIKKQWRGYTKAHSADNRSHSNTAIPNTMLTKVVESNGFDRLVVRLASGALGARAFRRRAAIAGGGGRRLGFDAGSRHDTFGRSARRCDTFGIHAGECTELAVGRLHTTVGARASVVSVSRVRD
jgi:hypothetical protein